jgi:glycosyltransferase involved in cell wall biosynthesis
MRTLGFGRPINWVFNPAAAVIAGTLGEDRVIYYCVDEFTAFAGVATQSMRDLEAQLARRADIVIVSAERLYRSKAPMNANTHLVRHGVDFAHFRKAVDASAVMPDDIAGLPRPILGYFGLIAQDWVDVPLLVKVAKEFPDASLVMIGKSTMDVSELARLPNVHLLGRKPYADLPGYARAFDVALIPFPINEVTLNSNPLKAREYLAAGLPVVSTRVPEVEVLGQCRIADDPESFCQQIRHALAEPGPSAARGETMRPESWEARLAQIERLFAALPER